MENILLIACLSLVVIFIFVLVFLLMTRAKLSETKNNLKRAESTLDKQTKIVKESNASASKVSEIQQKAKENEKKLVDAVKGAQTSAEPIKKSIDLGNDIVGKFNNSK